MGHYGYGRKAWEVVGYTYAAETLCPACTLAGLPTGEGETFDGWHDATEDQSVEDNLTELAAAFGIDREDECTFDSDEFPKVIFSSDSEDETCGACGVEL